MPAAGYLSGNDFITFSFGESVWELSLRSGAAFTVSGNRLYMEANSTTEEEKREKLSSSSIDSATLQRKSDKLLSSGSRKTRLHRPGCICGAPNDFPVDLAPPLKVRE